MEELEADPHPLLARLRECEPVSWLPALECWLVTGHDLTLQVMRDAATFTVDDPRFSTGQVVGPSMLTLDGHEHARHRDPFARAFALAEVRERFTALVEAETDRLIDAIEPAGRADLRVALTGPLSVAAVTHALGLADADAGDVLAWYAAIVAAVTNVTAGGGVTADGRAAFEALRSSIERTLDDDACSSLLATAAGLSRDEVVSNAAVLMFGGIETTDGMISNLLLHLLAHPAELALVAADRSLIDDAVEESLRLEPAASVIDRYATADTQLGGASIGRRELVRVSIAGANRDPRVFEDPDRFDVRRRGVRRHIAFAHGPHVCVGIHLARLEASVAIRRLLDRLPGLRLDPERPSAPHGLVFRKPPAVHVVWDRA
ncbi:MAG: cytochrome P450 [Thermoleophilia bacterium]|nr:cytochrome P450 [Thermoleophilia bacterium]